MSQPQANFTIHPLSAVLNKALDARGHQPARLTEEMLSRLERETPQGLGIDGTERRINRPTDDLGQRTHYSGKKMPHLEEQPCRRAAGPAGQVLGLDT